MKKIFAMLLALILVFGLIACGSSTTATPPAVLDQTTVPSTPDEPETPADPSAPAEEEKDEWDGDYETATFADVRKYGIGSTKWDGSLPLSTTGEKLTMGLAGQAIVSDYDSNELTKWVEETTGLDLVFWDFAGSGGDVATQLSLMFTGGEKVPDILEVRSLSAAVKGEYVQEGYLANVAGYYMTDSYYYGKVFEQIVGGDPQRHVMFMNAIETSCVEMETGQCFGQAYIADNPMDAVQIEAHINTEWLQKLGLQKPTTIDELYNVLVAFKNQDPNGNGKKDEVPMMGLTYINGRGADLYLINAFVQYAPSRYAMIEDGKAFSPWVTDEYREALKFINKLVKERLLSTTTFVGAENNILALLNPEKGKPFTVGLICAYTAADFYEDSGALDVYAELPALKDATGRGGYSIFDAGVVNNRYAISGQCENVQLAWRFMDFMSSEEANLRQRFGTRGVDWDYIEDTQYKDKAAGNGIYGGEARFVVHQFNRLNTKWNVYFGIWTEKNPQMYCDPENPNFTSRSFKRGAQNALMQMEIGEPEDQLKVFTRTPEEDDRFSDLYPDLNYYSRMYRDEFCMGYKNPNDDAVWNEYIQKLEGIGLQEVVDIAQASFDRQQAEVEEYIASQQGK